MCEDILKPFVSTLSVKSGELANNQIHKQDAAETAPKETARSLASIAYLHAY